MRHGAIAAVVAGALGACTTLAGLEDLRFEPADSTKGGGNAGAWAKLGGVMVRHSLSDASRNRRVGAIAAMNARNTTYRLSDGAATTATGSGAGAMLPEYYRLTRMGDDVTTEFSFDGVTWSVLGAETTFGEPLGATVLVGIPHASDGQTGWVETEWFRVRKFVAAEPMVALGAEQVGNP